MEKDNIEFVEAEEIPLEYVLNHGERRTMLALNQALLVEKMQVYGLNQQMDELGGKIKVALGRVDAAQAAFMGALNMVAHSRNMSNAQITPEFDRIFIPKGKQS